MPPMSLKKIYDGVEKRIQEAIARGEFDNLPGKGKPLDLRAWEKTPPHLRMGYTLLKNAGMAPVEVQAKQEIAEIREQLADTEDPEEKRRLTNRLNALMTTYAIRVGEQRRRD